MNKKSKKGSFPITQLRNRYSQNKHENTRPYKTIRSSFRARPTGPKGAKNKLILALNAAKIYVLLLTPATLYSPFIFI